METNQRKHKELLTMEKKSLHGLAKGTSLEKITEKKE
jgi:hypothetical protein